MAYFQFANVSISGITVAVPKNLVQINSVGTNLNKKTIDLFNQQSGIKTLHISSEQQTASDLGFVAAKELLDKKNIKPDQIGLILFVSKTPDYRSPPTSFVLHHRLNLDKDCLAYDINMGSAGFIYGLQVGCSLVENMPVKYGLVIIGDTTSKQISDKNPLMMKFGDGTSAILLEKNTNSKPISILTRSFGDGYNSFIVPEGGFRNYTINSDLEIKDLKNYANEDLIINDSTYHSFILSEVPNSLMHLLKKTKTTVNDYDIFAIQQESIKTLKDLSEILGAKFENIPINIDKYGNTCGASIPLLLSEFNSGYQNINISVLAIDFGEGFSLGSASFYIESSNIFPVIFTDDFYTEGSVGHEI